MTKFAISCPSSLLPAFFTWTLPLDRKVFSEAYSSFVRILAKYPLLAHDVLKKSTTMLYFPYQEIQATKENQNEKRNSEFS
jgi:hypothetical protein